MMRGKPTGSQVTMGSFPNAWILFVDPPVGMLALYLANPQGVMGGGSMLSVMPAFPLGAFPRRHQRPDRSCGSKGWAFVVWDAAVPDGFPVWARIANERARIAASTA